MAMEVGARADARRWAAVHEVRGVGSSPLILHCGSSMNSSYAFFVNLAFFRSG